jgi:hypothetical protein
LELLGISKAIGLFVTFDTAGEVGIAGINATTNQISMPVPNVNFAYFGLRQQYQK